MLNDSTVNVDSTLPIRRIIKKYECKAEECSEQGILDNESIFTYNLLMLIYALGLGINMPETALENKQDYYNRLKAAILTVQPMVTVEEFKMIEDEYRTYGVCI